MKLFSRKAKKPAPTGPVEVRSPFDGKVVDLDKVNDPVFAQKMMGDGIAIVPTSSSVYAPVPGTLTSTFPTGHAYTITSKQGHGLLLHIGLDTVALNGEGFSNVVSKKGISVTCDTKLCELDLKLLTKKAKSLQSPVLLVADETMKSGTITMKCKHGEIVKKGDILYVIS